MLCPSCGKSVGEVMSLCAECAELKRVDDERKAAEEAERIAELGEQEDDSDQNSGKQVDALGLDDETRLLLIKAIGIAIAVLVVILLLVLIIS